jgi:shikimate dehydrogenase
MGPDPRTGLNLIIGYPIGHSLSPSYHQTLYQAHGINAIMLAVENPNLSELVQSIKALTVRLTAVTLPFKTAILNHVDQISDEVKMLGAANTLILENGKIHAHNTDVAGIQAALSGMDLQDKTVMILGAGGAARAVGYALSQSGAELVWLNRTQEKAQRLADLFGGIVINQPINADLIINATSVGMSVIASPAGMTVIASPVLGARQPIPNNPLHDYPFKPNQTVFDLVYNPIETPLLKAAKMAGATCLSGMIMFEAQAKKQVALAYGVCP